MKPKKTLRLALSKKSHLKNRRFKMPYKGRLIDLGDIEEIRDRSFFLEVGQHAAQNAVNENKAMRIPVTFLQDGWIVRRMPDGNLQRIFEIRTGNEKFKNRRIAKGTILNVGKTPS